MPILPNIVTFGGDAQVQKNKTLVRIVTWVTTAYVGLPHYDQFTPVEAAVFGGPAYVCSSTRRCAA